MKIIDKRIPFSKLNRPTVGELSAGEAFVTLDEEGREFPTVKIKLEVPASLRDSENCWFLDTTNCRTFLVPRDKPIKRVNVTMTVTDYGYDKDNNRSDGDLNYTRI